MVKNTKIECVSSATFIYMCVVYTEKSQQIQEKIF